MINHRARHAFAFVLLLGAGALVLAGTRPAHACSCASPALRWQDLVLPADGAVASPNTRIWIWGGDDVELRDGTGRLIAHDASTIDALVSGVPLTVLTPVELLEPGQYQISHRTTHTTTHFSVTGASDGKPPAIPEVIDVVREASDDGGTCGKWRGVTLTLQGEGVLLMREPETLPETALDAQTLSGSVDDFAVDRGHGYGFGYSDGLCSSWPSSNDTLVVQFGSVDLAGNFSGWSETQHFKRPTSYSQPSCTISLGRARPHIATGTAGLVLVALLARRLQRRRR